MADIVSPAVRSRMMSGIRSTDTKPEMLVRRSLHAAGFRYRLHDGRLPGRPDLVLPRYRAVIFVHGCFWHGHGCHLFRLPGTRREFWQEKIAGNARRDGEATARLYGSGWRVATVWECSLRGRTRRPLADVSRTLAGWLRADSPTLEIAGLSGG